MVADDLLARHLQRRKHIEELVAKTIYSEGSEDPPLQPPLLNAFVKQQASKHSETSGKKLDSVLSVEEFQMEDRSLALMPVKTNPTKVNADVHTVKCGSSEDYLSSGVDRLTAENPTLHFPVPKVERELRSERIHILGTGLVGKYIAHNIASLDHAPPVILLMHQPYIMQKFHDEGTAIRLLKDGMMQTRKGFHLESSASFRRESDDQRFVGFGENLEHTSEAPSYAIDTLVVTTHPHMTVSALSSIRHRIQETTTICIVQEGLGMVEKLNKILFQDPYQRPTYVLGSLKHDLDYTENEFTIVERGPAQFRCSKLPRILATESRTPEPPVAYLDFSWSPEARHLVGTFHRTPELKTTTLPYHEFHKEHLAKLAVEAVIGPLVVFFDCTNEQLLYNYSVSQVMKCLLQEVSSIITSLPELRKTPGVMKDLSAQKLEYRVLSRIKTTGKSVAKMLANVRSGKRTDIEFYTGYLIDRARDLKIPCPINQMLYNMVKGKQAIKNREIKNYIPYQ